MSKTLKALTAAAAAAVATATATAAAAAAAATPRPIQATSTAIGVVTAAHRCMSTVKVRVAKQVWNSHLRKNYTRHTSHLCDDHALACFPGDIVTIAAGLRSSKHKRHVVDKLVSPVRTGAKRTLPEGVDGWIKRREEQRAAKAAALAKLAAEAAALAEKATQAKLAELARLAKTAAVGGKQVPTN